MSYINQFRAATVLVWLTLFLMTSGVALAKDDHEDNKGRRSHRVTGLYEGTVSLDQGDEPLVLRLGKDGLADLISPDELQQETPGTGLWRRAGSDGGNLRLEIVYEQYFTEPLFGCSADSIGTNPFINWGCVFHVAIEATLTNEGKLTGQLFLSGGNASTPNVNNFTLVFPVEFQRRSFDELWDRARGMP